MRRLSQPQYHREKTFLPCPSEGLGTAREDESRGYRGETVQRIRPNYLKSRIRENPGLNQFSAPPVPPTTAIFLDDAGTMAASKFENALILGELMILN